MNTLFSKLTQPSSIEVNRICTHLRGGSRSCRVLADNGKQYILKLHDNPQGNFSLIAEFLGTKIMEAMGLPVPVLAWARVRKEDIREQLRLRSDFDPNQTHLAIAYPVDSQLHRVLDELPEPNWNSLTNRDCFWGALVADKWLANVDCRQAVFVRRRSLNSESVVNVSTADDSTGIQAILIDQGLCFNGRSMNFKVAPAHGLYPSSHPYRGLETITQLQPWIEIAQRFTAEDLGELLATLPPSWLNSEILAYTDLLCSQLIHRATKLSQILESTLPLVSQGRKFSLN